MTPTECAWCAETLIIRHDEQHVWCALRRHDARRPPRRRLRGLLIDYPAELRIGRRKLFSCDRRGGARRTCDTSDLLSQCRDATKDEKTRARNQAATDFHGGKLHLRMLCLGENLLAHFGGKNARIIGRILTHVVRLGQNRDALILGTAVGCPRRIINGLKATPSVSCDIGF